MQTYQLRKQLNFFYGLSTGIIGPDNPPSKPETNLVQAGDL